MANLLEIAEVSWKQLFPNPTDENAISKEEFIATAKTEYATQMWIQAKNEKNSEGYFNIPSYLLTEAELEVKNNEMDISSLKILRGLPEEMWLQNIGGIVCDCSYVKSNINLAQLMCDDDSLGDNFRTYYVVGNKIKFPKGTHSTKLPIIYANNGERVDNNIEIDDAIGGIVRRMLIEIYGGKIGKEDTSNNSRSDD